MLFLTFYYYAQSLVVAFFSIQKNKKNFKSVRLPNKAVRSFKSSAVVVDASTSAAAVVALLHPDNLINETYAISKRFALH